MIAHAVLDRADRMNRKFWETIFDQPFPGEIVTDKLILIASYVDLALEHQSAITFLVRHHHTGSAMALVRPVYEMLYRGIWILGCATEADAEKARRDRLTWPEMGRVVKEADDAFDGDGFLTQLKKKNWKVVNSYTHSGALQTGSRFSGNELHPSYADHEQIHAVEGTLIAAGLLAVPFLKIHGRFSQAEEIERLLLELS